MTLLALEAVSKSFGAGRRRRLAVDGVSLTVARGEIVGLVGESGCGKSTLARLALRLVDPDQGRILFDGTDVTGLSGSALAGFRRRIQLVFQDPLGSLNPRATIRALLEDPLRVNRIGSRDERRRQAERIAARVRLPLPLLDRYPHEISGGQRQRVGIGRALALAPDLIVCDEPVSSLDVSIRAQIVNLLLDLRRDSGVALLFISHDLALVRRVADRVAVMRNGVIVETGPSETVWRHPAADYTRALIAAQPRLTRGEPAAEGR
jgi:peptide/nickel transport system ATP-binding protein